MPVSVVPPVIVLLLMSAVQPQLPSNRQSAIICSPKECYRPENFKSAVHLCSSQLCRKVVCQNRECTNLSLVEIDPLLVAPVQDLSIYGYQSSLALPTELSGQRCKANDYRAVRAAYNKTFQTCPKHNQNRLNPR